MRHLSILLFYGSVERSLRLIVPYIFILMGIVLTIPEYYVYPAAWIYFLIGAWIAWHAFPFPWPGFDYFSLWPVTQYDWDMLTDKQKYQFGINTDEDLTGAHGEEWVKHRDKYMKP